MRVGTDGVLVGAWARGEGCLTMLDVGTGCGLIALMLAQRFPTAQITGIELHSQSVLEAKANVSLSPWSERIGIVEGDFCQYDFGRATFDLIVSNPPFHTESLQSPQATRAMARHVGRMDPHTLLGRSRQLLTPRGRLSLIVPASAEEKWVAAGREAGLRPGRLTRVFGRVGKPCRRALIEFVMADGGEEGQCPVRQLYITDNQGQYTEEYRALTRAFYLNM